MRTAYETRVIVETRRGSLRSQAISGTRAIVEGVGLIYVRSAADVRWNAEAGRAEVFAFGEWLQVSDLGIADWAADEGLDWRRADGVIVPARGPEA